MASTSTTQQRHRVVIIGSGFGGLFAAKALKRAPVDVTLVSKTTHHLFQPLLYQVATGILSSGEIAPATRAILAKQKNARVLAGEVVGIDLQRKVLTVDVLLQFQYEVPFDSLVVAAGAGQSYFGNDQFAEHAPGMKSIDDALELRGMIFGAFEMAEVDPNPEAIPAWMTFVVVGAGPTGVEMAGQIAELAHRTLRHDFRRINPRDARIILLDAAPAVLPPFGPKLGKAAQSKLESLGVEVRLGAKVVNVDADGLDVEDQQGGRQRIASRCKVWAAGVQASPLGKVLAEQSDAQLDRAGRVQVNPDLTLPGHPDVFVIGDMMALNNLPGVAQVAMQGGKHAANTIKRRVKGAQPPGDFSYFDKGSMATISRFSAVVKVGKVEMAGFLAWLMWLFIHLVYLVGFKNRFSTLANWFVTFLGRSRSQRSMTTQQVLARRAIEKLAELEDADKPRLPDHIISG
jgi:NADH dehydrogenase